MLARVKNDKLQPHFVPLFDYWHVWRLCWFKHMNLPLTRHGLDCPRLHLECTELADFSGVDYSGRCMVCSARR